MDINDFILKFSQQFEKTDIDEFTPDTIFWNLSEWSSLTALSVIAMIDEEYGVTLRSSDLKHIETIADLFNFVNARL